MEVIIGLLLLISANYVSTQLVKLDLPYREPLFPRFGLLLPHELGVVLGGEAHIRFVKDPGTTEACLLHTPAGNYYNLATMTHDRFEVWEPHCGVRIKNINANDAGRWRLTAVRPAHNMTAFSTFTVFEHQDYFTTPTISIKQSTLSQDVRLTNLTNEYCYVARPFSTSSLAPRFCDMHFDTVTRSMEGVWRLNLGVPGVVEEVPLQTTITVQSELMETGYVHNENLNKINLYCNIKYSERNITFCRFQRSNQPHGYHIMDGLSNGRFSYYGDGFRHHHCGLTIESPEVADFATWRCTIGLDTLNAGGEIVHSTMVGLVSVPSNLHLMFMNNLRNVFNTEEENEVLVFSILDEPLKIDFDTNEPITYCWFHHPNGSHFTPAPLTDGEPMENVTFWNSGTSFDLGDCSITFKKGSTNDTGLWVVHWGSRNSLGIEQTAYIRVRVSGTVAAVEQEVVASQGSEVTLRCVTAGEPYPMEYCRFQMPNGTGINIDSTITRERAILNRYYFPEGLSVGDGVCAVTIIDLQDSHYGTWVCASVVVGRTEEGFDTIQIVTGSGGPSLASTIGLSAGGGVLIIILAAVLLFRGISRYRRPPANDSPIPSVRNSRTVAERINMEPMEEREVILEPSALTERM